MLKICFLWNPSGTEQIQWRFFSSSFFSNNQNTNIFITVILIAASQICEGGSASSGQTEYVALCCFFELSTKPDVLLMN